MQRARRHQASKAFCKARKRRQEVEHRIARLRQLGVKQARYVGHAKTLFQLLLGATVANLTLVAGLSRRARSLPFDLLAYLVRAVRAVTGHIRPFVGRRFARLGAIRVPVWSTPPARPSVPMPGNRGFRLDF